ncbi:hypothetical protein [Sulfitobacter pontiacus]|uniref:hypothetical protein n=1 Tax=Sulfitobacter pontiacus TaxID=60137 RepID=UPI0021FAFA76|nr:hypothetical protein K3755_07350 [Sulfitobacter pontiacus]
MSIEASPKCRKGVHIEGLATFLDKRRDEACKEHVQFHRHYTLRTRMSLRLT